LSEIISEAPDDINWEIRLSASCGIRYAVKRISCVRCVLRRRRDFRLFHLFRPFVGHARVAEAWMSRIRHAKLAAFPSRAVFLREET
jgi:hypothetical protein